MKFLIVLAFVGLAAADVSHLANSYLPPRVSSPVISYNQGSDAIYSSPIVNTYTTQQEVRPAVTYSRQVNVAPSYQVINSAYDSGLSGNSLSGDSGYYGNSGVVSSSYDSGLSGGNYYQGGLSGSGYQSSGQLIGGGASYGGSGYGGQIIGGGASYGGSGYGGNVVHTVSAPVITNTYETTVDTQYGSNGGYVYQRKH